MSKSFETENHRRRHWVWVADQRSYLDEGGNDHPDLDPANESAAYAYCWWTCHKNARKGDLALLYRSRIAKDVGYLAFATSDSYSLADNKNAVKNGWDYGCECAFIYKFRCPLTLGEIRADSYLRDWTANRGNFQKKVYEISPSDWIRLKSVLAARNRGFKTFLSKIERANVPDTILLEEEMEEIIANDLPRLRKFGFDLELCSEKKDGYSGRQVVCEGGHGGRIDLLCYDRKKERYVVIELKNVRANQNTYGQVLTYVGWVQKNIARRKNVIGIVISRGYDARFAASMQTSNKVVHIDLNEIGFE